MNTNEPWGGTALHQSQLDPTPREPLETFAVHQELAMYHNVNSVNRLGWWLVFLQQEKYFMNLFKWNTEDKEFKRIRPQLMYICWNYGAAGVKKLSNGKYVACALADISIDGAGKVTASKGYIVSQNKMSTNHISLSEKNTCFIQWGRRAWPSLIVWKTFCMNVDVLLRTAMTDAKVKGKKFIYFQQDSVSAASKVEQAAMLNPDNPYVTIIGNENALYNGTNGMTEANGGTRFENKINTFDKGTFNSVWEDLDAYLAYMYLHEGRESQNNNFKKERNITAEFEQEKTNYEIVLLDVKEFHEWFLEDVKEVFGVTVTLEEVEEEVEENNKEMLNNGKAEN